MLEAMSDFRTGIRIKHWGFLLPLLLCALVPLGWWLAGAWHFLVPAVVYGLIPLLDMLLGEDRSNPAPEEETRLERALFHRFVLYAYVPLHFALLAGGALLIAGGGLRWWETTGLVLSVGTITGGLGITVAHELGHKLSRPDRLLSRLLLASVCYMHFHIEHNKGHHARVATPEDPATARFGESFYRFWPRTVAGSFLSAWRIEARRLARRGLPPWHWRNQVYGCVAAALAFALAALLLAGVAGLAYFLAQSLVAVSLLELVNYIEHYGLRRRRLAPGAYEKVDVRHSWNTSRRLTNFLLFNLQRHSHHHARQHLRYQLLRHYEASPQLPTGYPGMILLALVPPLWRRVMHPRLRGFRARSLAA